MLLSMCGRLVRMRLLLLLVLMLLVDLRVLLGRVLPLVLRLLDMLLLGHVQRRLLDGRGMVRLRWLLGSVAVAHGVLATRHVRLTICSLRAIPRGVSEGRLVVCLHWLDRRWHRRHRLLLRLRRP